MKAHNKPNELNKALSEIKKKSEESPEVKSLPRREPTPEEISLKQRKDVVHELNLKLNDVLKFTTQNQGSSYDIDINYYNSMTKIINKLKGALVYVKQI